MMRSGVLEAIHERLGGVWIDCSGWRETRGRDHREASVRGGLSSVAESLPSVF